MSTAVPINPEGARQPVLPRFGRMDLGLEHVKAAIDHSVEWLLSLQSEDGYWCGELEADSMLESDYIFMHTLLGTGDRGRMERAVNEILRHQNADGGWSNYPGGPSNVSYGVKCYLALKLMGWTAEHPVMVKARENVLGLGGVVECNTFTKIYLCALGAYDYDAVPAIPPEIVLFRTGSTSIFMRSVRGRERSWCRFQSSTRRSHSRSSRLIRESTNCSLVDARTLICGCSGTASTPSPGAISSFLPIVWRTSRSGCISRPLRKMALKKAERWMLEHFEAVRRAWAPSLSSQRCSTRLWLCEYLGYSADDPQVIRAMDEFERLGIDCPNGTPDYPKPTFRMQPCFSPVWDTAQVLSTLGECGLPRGTTLRLVKAADWLLSKEIRYKGDWSRNVKDVDASCWCFFFNNDHQPDVDDTGEVLLALKSVDNPRERYQHETDAACHCLGLCDAMQERRLGVFR